MSGFEVVGVLLGIIPLIISATDKFRSTRKFSRELKSLRRVLDVELIILQDTFEKLLCGFVEDRQIEAMLRNPFEPLWRDSHISGYVRSRLWKSTTVFEETVREMEEAVQKIAHDFGLDMESNVMPTQNSTLASSIQLAKHFIRRSKYEELLKVIRDGNETLTKLLNTCKEPDIELGRRRRSQGRLATLTRMLARSAYNAINSSISCNCAPLHGLNLNLQSSRNGPCPQDDDETIISTMSFWLILTYCNKTQNSPDIAWLCDNIELRVEVQEDRIINEKAIPSKGLPRGARGKVRFQEMTTIKSSKQHLYKSPNGSNPNNRSQLLNTTECTVIDAVNDLAHAFPRHEVTDLCETIRKYQHTEHTCYGYLTDKMTETPRSFAAYPRHAKGKFSHPFLISLEDVLDNQKGSQLPPLDFRSKNLLAATVASNMVYLSGTPWLPNALASRSILFVHRSDPDVYNQAYLSKELPKANTTTTSSSPQPANKVNSNALFSLGIVLLEIALGQRLDTLRRFSKRLPTSDEQVLLQDYETAVEYLDSVEKELGSSYAQAVRCCIKCEFRSPNPSLDDEDFRYEFYGKVVSLLEDNVVAMRSGIRHFS